MSPSTPSKKRTRTSPSADSPPPETPPSKRPTIAYPTINHPWFLESTDSEKWQDTPARQNAMAKLTFLVHHTISDDAIEDVWRRTNQPIERGGAKWRGERRRFTGQANRFTNEMAGWAYKRAGELVGKWREEHGHGEGAMPEEREERRKIWRDHWEEKPLLRCDEFLGTLAQVIDMPYIFAAERDGDEGMLRLRRWLLGKYLAMMEAVKEFRVKTGENGRGNVAAANKKWVQWPKEVEEEFGEVEIGDLPAPSRGFRARKEKVREVGEDDDFFALTV